MNFFNMVLNFIYTPVCGICGKDSRDFLCDKCFREYSNKEIANIEINKEPNFYFDEKIHLFMYKDEIRNKIIDYKFNGKAYLYKTFSEFFVKNKKINVFFEKYDIIIAVPMHKRKEKIRGYNQSALIAKEIANRNNKLKYENDILLKIINNKVQSTLSKKEREINVKNAYKVLEKQKLINKNVIIFDDIYTTGNTVNECARILKENGANKIGILTIAKD